MTLRVRAEADHAGRAKEFPIAMAALWVDFQKFASKAQEEGVIEDETEKRETMSTNNLSTLRS